MQRLSVQICIAAQRICLFKVGARISYNSMGNYKKLKLKLKERK